ncbi:hypothetical protein [Caenispirillum bisanense]|nr:hypothetical protein [Caenispirillum bisanense]
MTPFDLNNLRLDLNYLETGGVKKLLNTVPVRKPHRQEFFRVHPDAGSRALTLVVDYKGDNLMYLVHPSLRGELVEEAIPVTLYLAINRAGAPFLFPCKMPLPDGKILDWHRSALEAAEYAMTGWVRMQANMALGAYDIAMPQGQLAEPAWPEEPFQKIVEIAFRNRLIDSLDHPVVKDLRGFE